MVASPSSHSMFCSVASRSITAYHSAVQIITRENECLLWSTQNWKSSSELSLNCRVSDVRSSVAKFVSVRNTQNVEQRPSLLSFVSRHGFATRNRGHRYQLYVLTIKLSPNTHHGCIGGDLWSSKRVPKAVIGLAACLTPAFVF